MSRFYKGPEADYVNDFIYQPPWELMGSALAKKEEDIQQQANQMELLRNLKIDYMDGHKGDVDRIKNELETEIDGLAGSLQKDLLNPENKAKIQNLQRELQKRYTSGDIYNIQKTKENMTALEAKIAAEEDPYIRDTYRKKLLNPFWENEDTLSKPFSYDGEIYGHRNLYEEFASSDAAKTLKPDDIQTAFSYLQSNGKYRAEGTNQTGGVALKKVQDALKGFIEQENIKGFALDREKNFDQIWTNEKGELDWETEGAEPKKLLDAVVGMSNKVSRQTLNVSTDPYALGDYNAARAAKETAVERALVFSKNSNASSYYKTPEGKQVAIARDTAEKLFVAQALGLPEDEHLSVSDERVTKYIKTLEKLAKDPEIPEEERAMNQLAYNDYMATMEKYNIQERAGVGNLVRQLGGSQANVDKMESIFSDEDAAKEIAKHAGYAEFPLEGGKTGFAGGNTGTKYRPHELKGKSLEKVPGFRGRDMVIGHVEVQTGAEFLPAAQVTETGETISGAKVTLLVYPVKKDARSSFKVGEEESEAPFPISFYVNDDPLNLGF